MRVDLGIMAGDESKKFLVSLGEITERLEKVARALRSPDELEEAATKDEEEVKPAKRGRPAKAAAPIEEDADFSDDIDFDDEDENEDEEVVVAPKKKAKATYKDVCAAAQERASQKNGGIKEVMRLLQKEFGIKKNLQELDSDDFANAIEHMKTAPIVKGVK